MLRPFQLPVALCATCVWSFILAAPVSAQDARVFTSVVDISGPSARPLSHSLTLFHAGKVYDYLEDVGEVVIFEPDHQRFIILGKNFVATEVPFTEVHHFLDSARAETAKYIAELTSLKGPESLEQVSALKFQLEPEFKEALGRSGSLELHGKYLSYDVLTAQPEMNGFAQRYLDYADWAARLNYVLHPNSSYPAARIQLNEQLRQAQAIPTQVDLTLPGDEPVRLQASHSYAWEFLPVDRQLISHWERTLSSNQLRWVTFHEYQRELLVHRSR